MRALLFTTILLLVVACGKETEDEAMNGQVADPCGVVSGIHTTDNNGVLMYPYDTTDWQPFEDWCPAVDALFAGLTPVTIASDAPDSLLIIAYPNPTDDQFMLIFLRDDTSYVDLRFTDDQFHLLWSVDSLIDDHLLVHTDSLGIASPQLVRAYYRVVHTDGSAHRGHGDVKVDP